VGLAVHENKRDNGQQDQQDEDHSSDGMKIRMLTERTAMTPMRSGEFWSFRD